MANTHDHTAMEPDEILMKEPDILAGLLALNNMRGDNAPTRLIHIVRETGNTVEVTEKGVKKYVPEKKVMVKFRVRALSEEESQDCHRNATKYAKTKPGQPRVPLETDASMFRSHVIYAATLDADKAMLWDNKRALKDMNLLQGVDMVDQLLLPGEKSRIIQEIDELSGFVPEAEVTAKN